MTTINAPAPTIAVRERYLDVVSDRWPGVIAPQPDELLSSWLHRLAYANGVAPRSFARVLGLNPGMWSAALDLRLPADIGTLLYAKTGVAPDRLAAMTLSHDLPKQLLLLLRYNGHRDSSSWLQFCCRCLAEDAQPYFSASMAAGDTGFLHSAWLSFARPMSVLPRPHYGLRPRRTRAATLLCRVRL